jgi:spore maturation protein A
MNTVFLIILFIALLLVTIMNPESALAVMLEGATGAINLSVKLLAIYAVWLSVLKLIERTGLDKKLSGLFLPITDHLFKGETKETKAVIGLNLAANMLGMGGAATPLGIRAMELMDKGDGKATDNMIMLMIISATSIQLLPATIMALRSAAGSSNSSDIILPSLISTVVTTGIGIILVKILSKRKNKK